MQIALDNPMRDDVLPLLTEHLAEMRRTSPPESVHALDPDELAAPNVRFWTLRDNGTLLGCAAVKSLSPEHAEIKSMRTAPAARRRGIAAKLLDHLLSEARTHRYQRVSLETGAEDFFAPARALYKSRGFTECDPFADYRPDPNSVFMTLAL